MNHRLLDFLIDPNDAQPLELRTFEGHENQTREGALINAKTRRWYPIRDGIPSVFCDDFRVGDLKTQDEIFAERYKTQLEDVLHLKLPSETTQQHEQRVRDLARMESERRARDEQAESYDRMLSMKTLRLFEVPAYARAMIEYSKSPRDLPLLEAGCGTGRFTDLFARYASEVVAVDLSRDSILRNRTLHAGKTDAPVHYLHADLTHLPLRDEAFGRVANVGVYEHLPSHEIRAHFVRHAHRVLLRDGDFLLSAYRYGGLTKLMQKEGEHDGGIPFHRFTLAEMRNEIAPLFETNHTQENVGVYMTMLVATPKK